jgi:hypothetical protein
MEISPETDWEDLTRQVLAKFKRNPGEGNCMFSDGYSYGRRMFVITVPKGQDAEAEVRRQVAWIAKEIS